MGQPCRIGKRPGQVEWDSAVTGACRERTGTRSEAGARAGGAPITDLSRAASCLNDMNAASMLAGAAMECLMSGTGCRKGEGPGISLPAGSTDASGIGRQDSLAWALAWGRSVC